MATILLIDDDSSIRSVFKRFLERHEYSVSVAEDGEAALRLLDEVSPDLVVTDIMMPHKDGIEVILELRKQHPDLPIIAISGGMRVAPMDFLPMVKKFGVKKVFYKPVELSDLLCAIREELGQ